MPKALIIAEKPSLAKNIAAAITPRPQWVSVDAKNHTGYYENDEYRVTYAFGHLLELKNAEEYNAELKKWSLDTLPIIPEKFEYTPKGDSGVMQQLSLIKKLINDKTTTRIVHAGDAGREGEIIVRNILNYCGNIKPVYRLWMPDQTPKTIQNELKSMKLDSEYDNLAEEGYARTYIDWLYGINLTRLASIKANKLLRVGRVTSPIISAIYAREKAIEAFKPTKYYVPEHERDDLKLSSANKYDTPQESDDTCSRYNTLPLTVTEKKVKKEMMARPKLLALSDLQTLAGKKHKMTPKETLDILQTLYEAGYVTYPRTNSNNMSENEKDKAKDIIAAVQSQLGAQYAGIAFRDDKAIFDNAGIEDHSAITPTDKVPQPSSLSDDQFKVYSIILNRFAAAFCKEDYVLERTNVTISNGEEDFTVNGDVVVQEGYTKFEPQKCEQELPVLNKGDVIEPAFKTTEKETQPPKHYTVGTLNEYLKHPYSQNEKKDLKGTVDKDIIDAIELGTEATRAGLIDAAIKSEYITLEKNKYGITPLGCYYCETLETLEMDMTKERTLNLSIDLKKIYKRKSTITEAMQDARDDVQSFIETGKFIKDVKQMDREPFCTCPVCGGPVYETKSSWSCADRNCNRAIFKNDFFFAKFQKPMTAAIAKSLLVKKYVNVKGLTSAKTGKKFDAKVVADFSDKYVKYKLEF